MLKPTENLIELTRNKGECIKMRAELDRINSTLNNIKVLSPNELKTLYEVREHFIKLNESEKLIDKHLQKFLN